MCGSREQSQEDRNSYLMVRARPLIISVKLSTRSTSRMKSTRSRLITALHDADLKKKSMVNSEQFIVIMISATQYAERTIKTDQKVACLMCVLLERVSQISIIRSTEKLVANLKSGHRSCLNLVKNGDGRLMLLYASRDFLSDS